MLSLVDKLRATNLRLSFQLDSIAARQATAYRDFPAPVVTPANMASLLSELLSAGAGLRAQPLPTGGNDQELERELAEYRRQVERLRDLLPSLHQELLAERARIEARRSRVLSVAKWARASRETL